MWACFLLGVMVLGLAHPAYAQEITWTGSLSLKNNYVVPAGIEIDSGPGLQFSTRGSFENGAYVALFSNLPLTRGNPNSAAEIDWTVGYSNQLGAGNLAVQLSYFDVQRPGLFDNQGDVWAPKLRFSSGRYYAEATYAAWDSARDAQHLAGGASYYVGDTWAVVGELSFVDGPFAAQEAIIGKVKITRSLPWTVIDTISVEAFDLLYQENPQDRRDFTVTVGFTRSLRF